MKTKSTFLHTAFFSTAVLPVLAASQSSSAVSEKPDILFIMLDDMGYGDAGCYNPEGKVPTPNIDNLAEHGMRFTDAHAAGSLCIPSRYGFLTGQYPCRSNSKTYHIRSGTETIASMLQRHSYATAMVGKWHNGFDNTNEWKGELRGGPSGCGFDYFFGIPHSLDIQPYLYIENNHVIQSPTNTIVSGKKATQGIYDDTGWNGIQGAFWREGKIAQGFKHSEVLGKFTSKSVSFIKNHGTRQPETPFFLYLAYAGPHTPWLPSDDFKGKSGAGLYGDFLMEIDSEIGRLIHALETSGFKDNTLIMLSSDNGPVWYPNNIKKYQHSSAGTLRGMKADAFEGGHRVPFIACWPGKIPANTVCNETICLTDMMSTMAAAAGVNLSGTSGKDSYNILPLLLGEQKKTARETTIHQAQFLAIRKGKYKFLDGNDSGGFSNIEFLDNNDPEKYRYIEVSSNAPQGQLYNLEEDPGETNNLFNHRPETVKELKKILDAYKAAAADTQTR